MNRKKEIIKTVETCGGEVLECCRTNSNHFKVRIRGSKGAFVLFTSCTPSCHHAERNFLADIKRGLRNGKV